MSGEVEKKQYMWQRRVMGVLVLLLAPLSVLFGLIGFGTNPAGWWYSISDTYYSNSMIIMVSIISISSFFFCTYGGYDWKDRVVNLMSGIGLAVLLLFPCGNEGMEGNLVGLFNLPINVSGVIHNIGACLAFLGFFINEMFIFTLGNGEKTKEKKRRNIIYRCCASCVIITAALIVMNNCGVPLPKNIIWIAEAIALEPCGFAWLVKGEALSFLNDK